MNLQEFDLEFDLLFNNIASNRAPGLAPLEKSVFLTEAQEFVLMEVYRSMEQTEEMTEYIATHIAQADLSTPITDGSVKNFTSPAKSYLYTIPEDLLEVVSEIAQLGGNGVCSTIGEIPVVPVTHDEFSRVRNNPFRGSSQYRLLRLTSQGCFEVFSDYPVIKYTIRYLKKPSPIVLPGCSGTLEPYSDHPSGKECELPESLHRRILLKAIELAKSSWA